VWQKEQAAYSHLVLIGHGKEDAIKFGVDDWIRADSLADILTGGNQKTFISLCCKTGNAAFAKKFSVQSNCGAFIAPFHGIHGAVASQFCQTFYSYNMLKGNTIPIAFKKARDAVVQGTSFRLWKNGNMLAGQK
jgi:hypothetical protein